MRYLVMYDISEDACRQRTAEYLEGRGVRIQESVFECNLQGEECSRVIEDLQKIIYGQTGNIRLYPLCAECYVKAIGIGETGKNVGENGYAIF